jgi:hypothetical protein
MTWIQNNWLTVLAVALLAGSIYPIPYFAYYQLMNWVVVGAALTVAWQAYKTNKTFIMWLFVFIAVVFNPIAPLHLRTDVWHIADVLAILLFVASFFLIEAKKK